MLLPLDSKLTSTKLLLGFLFFFIKLHWSPHLLILLAQCLPLICFFFLGFEMLPLQVIKELHGITVSLSSSVSKLDSGLLSSLSDASPPWAKLVFTYEPQAQPPL
ncbi:hypothetical protein PAXRUDRAFT_22194 [Paxillus rubicundulus Ve08.2h10]|uniref:Uncharacterized protein n=1 Tax=Paxillus rubicundulus Ve08.2h10 TaxID=930991 RepID=A0A0D0CNG8_9AGAM|nr:hypothetical protein PAXRUDRAFT_22194 [Paxillus rubicundulus Ve08.2h10]